MVFVNALPRAWQKKKVQDALRDVCEANNIVSVSLFGSHALGKAHAKSDIDLLISFDETCDKSLIDLIRVEFALSKVFKRKADVVTRAGVSPYMRSSIERSLKVLYER